MPLEDLVGADKFISNLNKNNPDGSTDYGASLDDHLRGIKNVLLNTFPYLTGAVNATQGELNSLAGRQSFIDTFLQAANQAAARAALDLSNWLAGTVRGYTQQQYHSQGTLTDGAAIDWDLDVAPAAKVTVGATGRTLNNPTNMKAGGWYSLLVTGAGSITSFGSAYKWPFGGGAPSLGAGETHIISFYCDGTYMYGVAVTDFQ